MSHNVFSLFSSLVGAAVACTYPHQIQWVNICNLCMSLCEVVYMQRGSIHHITCVVTWSLVVVGQSQSELLYSCEVYQGRQKQLKSGPAPGANIFLIELSGSSSQHEDVQSVHAWWDASIVQEVIKCVEFSEKLQTNVAPFEYWLLDCQKVVWPKLDQLDRLRCPCILCTQTNHWISMLAKAELGKVYFWLSHVQLSGKTKLDA